MGVLALALAGCRTVPPAGTAPCWPPPPATPRVVFAGEALDARGLGIQPSFWQRSVNLVTGADRGREPWICPFGVWMDDATNLCVTDTGRREVICVDARRRRLERWDRVGSQALVSPVGVTCASGLVYVADSGLGKVLIADAAGRPRGELRHAFRRPVALAAAAGHVYVADAVACCVDVFSMSGEWLRSIGTGGDGPGELNRPTHLAVDARGWVYVTDAMNNRVQVFDDTGRFVRSVGLAGDSSGHFGRPKGVAVDRQGRIYVADGLFDVVQIFDQEGRLLMDFGGPGQQAGEFWLPAGLAINAGGMLVVADSYNERLQLFRVQPPSALDGGAP